MLGIFGSESTPNFTRKRSESAQEVDPLPRAQSCPGLIGPNGAVKRCEQCGKDNKMLGVNGRARQILFWWC